MHKRITSIISAISILTSCTPSDRIPKGELKESDCCGKWEMVEDPTKYFLLNNDKKVIFTNINFSDLELDDYLVRPTPSSGLWLTWYDPDDLAVLMLIIKKEDKGNTCDCGIAGDLKYVKGHLEAWFPIYSINDEIIEYKDWKRFRKK